MIPKAVDHLVVMVFALGIWPAAVVVLVAVALVLTPRDQRVAQVRALVDLVRAARGRPR